jgi:hypothetical protein
MTLVAIASPETESDIAVISCVLEANDIPYFVQGSGFGGLFPGPRINGYNSRRVLVPASLAAEAASLLAELEFGVLPPQTPVAISPSTTRSKAALILEFLFIGWFVPTRSARAVEDDET